MKFFSVQSRFKYALVRGILIYQVIVASYLVFAVSESLRGVPHPDVSQNISFIVLALGTYTVLLMYPSDKRLKEAINQIPKNFKRLPKDEREPLKAECRALIRTLEHSKDMWDEATYKRAINDMIYPYLDDLIKNTQHNEGYFTAKERLTKARRMLKDYVKEHNISFVSSESVHISDNTVPVQLQQQVQRSLNDVKELKINEEEADALVESIADSLRLLRDNSNATDYLKHNTHLSRVFSVYMQHLQSIHNSYKSVSEMIQKSSVNKQINDEIKLHFIENLTLIDDGLTSALNEYILYEHEKVSASSSLLKEFSAKNG